MKRQIQRLLLVAIALFAIVNSMHAYDVAIDGIYYNLDNSTATATVTYRADKYSSYSYSNDVVIPSSITYEGKEYSVTTIGEYAFYNCQGLTSVTIPESVTEIDDTGFCGCTKLTSITIPESVTRIGNLAFSSCTGLTSITLSKNITEIGRGAFNRCNALTSIDLPESVTTIGEYAFQNCNELTSITIPKSVTTIGNGALSYCSGLTEVLVDASNPAYSSVDGILFNKEQTQIICYPSGKAGNRYTIPNSITSIGAYAFGGCERLTSITIPSNFTKIENCAFYGCRGLTSMTIPEGVTSIGYSAFGGCDNMTSITIPSSVTFIGEAAFAEDYKIEKVYISDLTAWCNIKFEYYSNPLSAGGHLYLNNTEITNLVIPSNVKEIKEYAFCGCKGLASVTIPESVTSIGYEAFSGCTGLTSITIPKSVTYIEGYAFSGCTLKSLYLFAKLSNYSDCFRTLNTSTVLFAYSSEMNSISEKWSGTVYDIEQSGGGIYISDCYLRGVSFYVVGNDHVPASLQSVKIGDTEYTPKEDGSYFVKDLDINTTYDIVATYKVDGDNTQTVTKTIQTQKPSIWATLQNSGQSTFTISLGVSNDESYTVTKKGVFISGDTYECAGNPFTVSGLKSATSYTVTPFAYYGNIMVTGYSYTYKTASLQPKLTPGEIGPTTFTATGSYTEGDATVSATGFYNYTEGNSLNLTGLKPNTRYTITYYVKTVEGGEETASYTFTTPALQLTTQQPKGVSSTCSIVSATTNISEEEMNVGFQWKKYDAPESLKASEGYAAVFDGQVEGYIKNLQPTSYYNVRAFYKSADGTYYYGGWVTFDPSDFSYFEPTVHTYAVQDVAYTTASVKGYVLSGTDEIKSQGFEYWAAGSESSNAKAVYATSQTGNISTIYASGQVMNATLQGLSEGTTYIYRAFVTTANGTFYGDEQTFMTKGDATGIKEMEDNTAERTVVGYYGINGEKRNTPAKGINIVLYSDGSTRKILVK